MAIGAFTAATPGGGTHLYFTAPPGTQLRNTAGRLGWLIDARATGGYVLAPGSLIGGKPYTVINPDPPEPLPGWLADRLTADPAPPEVTGTALADTAGPATRQAWRPDPRICPGRMTRHSSRHPQAG